MGRTNPCSEAVKGVQTHEMICQEKVQIAWIKSL
jgi:hypothetical protein